MKVVGLSFFFFLGWLIMGSACSFSGASAIRPQGAVADSIPTFPLAWNGIWSGDLAIYRKGKKVSNIPMQLHINTEADSTFWGIQYDTTDIRPYSITMINQNDGIYLMDEHNSILIESYLFDQKLIAMYDVSGNRLVVTEEKLGDTIIFEVIMGKTTPVSTTGNTQQKETAIPEVNTFPVLVYQKAILRKQS